jgi:hypothetical protein
VSPSLAAAIPRAQSLIFVIFTSKRGVRFVNLSTKG